MIRKLKTKFVFLAMAALLILLVCIVIGMNVINYRLLLFEADTTLSLLSGNDGDFPELPIREPHRYPRFLHVETPYESRYFSALLDHDGNVIRTDIRRIKAVNEEDAAIYGQKAFDSGKDKGFLDDYRFLRTSDDSVTWIFFLDCGRQLHIYQRFLTASIWMSAAGYLTFFAVIVFFSGIILQPVTESYEKQKRFITDAGHEIKTPLAIIKADADVLEMELGESEWLDGIQEQVRRLSGLTADLIYLSRMEEAEVSLPMVEFSFSDAVSETAMSFQALARTQNKLFLSQIPPILSYTGNEKAIRQLVNILMDNAIKYTPEQGQIHLTVQKTLRHITMTVCNTTVQPVTQEQLDRLFERFYRTDSSRSSQTGGYGIGLSIAQAITAAHNGKISAVSREEKSLEISVQLPV